VSLEDDLFDAGMTSLSSVKFMLALGSGPIDWLEAAVTA
jgi:hypothetical protein